MTAAEAAARVSTRESIARMAAAVELGWRACPLVLLGQVAVAVVGAVVPVAVAWLTKVALDGVVAGAGWGWLLGVAAGLAAAGVVTAVVPQVDRFFGQEMSRAIGLLGMDRLYRAVDRFVGLGRFEDPEFHDRLRLARSSGQSGPSDVLQAGIGVCRGVLTGVGFVGSLLVVSPAMTVAVLLCAVPAVWAERAVTRRRASMMWEISPGMRRELFYSVLLGEVRAAKEVRLFGIGEFLRRRMLAERGAANLAQRRIDLRDLWTQGALTLLLAVVAGAGLVWAVAAARDGRLSVGDVAMFVAAVAGAQGAVSQVVSSYALARQAMLMFEHFLAVLRVGPELPLAAAPTPTPALRGGIEFDDVWFRYAPEHPWVLRGVSLRIPHGEAVALAGVNGAGKTTIVKLLCRFYDPTRGAIRWDGVDLRDMAPDELRARMGAVFQDFMEYDLTAAENVGIGDVSAIDDRPRLHQAARLAGVHETLSDLPRGYDTLLSRMFAGATGNGQGDSEVGVNLSTGQWQRVALARAVFKDGPDLLILDEPSSGLDAEAEHQVHTMLRSLRAGRTSLLISHRLGAVRDADRIVVVADGRIAEEGAHAELMARGGRYARMFTLQAEGYRDEVADVAPG
ncbi:ABC transporter ATP-binding protein [Pseudonocardia acaciae]|uniref:ABC transporter ATP-binding protein n=1 Tax=Pseudonocardia acaciae TaxID=551276 RepID=UPI000685C103|nr:ABC transporter ATP-binding protein [Pseudonocardia acaciae]